MRTTLDSYGLDKMKKNADGSVTLNRHLATFERFPRKDLGLAKRPGGG